VKTLGNSSRAFGIRRYVCVCAVTTQGCVCALCAQEVGGWWAGGGVVVGGGWGEVDRVCVQTQGCVSALCSQVVGG
jgi:hypothetical protein